MARTRKDHGAPRALGHDPLAWIRDEPGASAPVAAPAAPVETVATGPIVLDETLGIAACRELHGRLKTAVAGGGAITLDASRVDAVDTAGLQVLVALARSLRQAGRTLSWQGVSTPLRSAAEVLALDGILGF